MHPITSCLAAMVLVITSWYWRQNIHFEMGDPTNWVIPLLGVATGLAIAGVVFNAALNQSARRVARFLNRKGEGTKALVEESEKEHVPGIVSLMLLGFLTANIPYLREGMHGLLETRIPIGGHINFEFGMEIASVLAVVLMIHVSALETELETMLENLGWATLIASLGVVVPGGLYFAFVKMYAPQTPFVENLGWGVLITATSMGIAGLILGKMGIMSSKTAQIVIAAAAIDDILGLAGLTTWQKAAASQGNIDASHVAALLGKNLAFMALAFIAGAGLAPRITRFMSRYAQEEKTLAVLLSLTSSFLFGTMAECWGLSALAGVYSGGAFLTAVMFKNYGEDKSEHKLEKLLEPLRAFVLPLFFIMIGRKVSLAALSDLNTWIMAGAGATCLLTGKAISVALLPKGVDRRTAFWGLLPRGEVLLVIATMVSRSMNSQQATVIMVVAVLLITGSTIAGALQVPKAIARARARDPHIFDPVVNGNSH